jgi:hypothetical protein
MKLCIFKKSGDYIFFKVKRNQYFERDLKKNDIYLGGFKSSGGDPKV